MSHNSYTTPEEYLARQIRKEFRKEERDEYKRTSRQTLTAHSGVRFSEPTIIVSSSGSYRPGYVITSPGMSVVQVPIVDQSSILQSQHMSGMYGGYYTQVPPELAARGIKAAVEKPRYRPSGPEKCRVLGCRIDHSNHYCNVCGNWNVTHSEDDCPLYKNRRY